jgi:hypothetical protein
MSDRQSNDRKTEMLVNEMGKMHKIIQNVFAKGNDLLIPNVLLFTPNQNFKDNNIVHYQNGKNIKNHRSKVIMHSAFMTNQFLIVESPNFILKLLKQKNMK